MSLAEVRRLVLGVEMVLLCLAVVVVLVRGGGPGEAAQPPSAGAPATAATAAPRSSADEDASEVITESERPPGEKATDTRPGADEPPARLMVLPVLPTSSVVSGGVSTSAGFVQVSVVATDDRRPAQVLAAYRQMLSEHGFVESVVPAVGGSTAAGFAHGAERLTVTTTAAGRRTRYSLLGRLRVTHVHLDR